jgi:hypothetical protein
MPRPLVAAVLAIVLLLPACAPPAKPEEVPSPDTIECQLEGDRWLIRFTDGEARLLPPGADRVVLYQVPAASGVRYTNGLWELRGKGMELTLVRENFGRTLTGCKPLMVPKEEPNPWLRMWQPPPTSPLSR